MPLRLRCQKCRRSLLVEDVFRGAHCRCQYCKNLIAVPRLKNDTDLKRSPRPERPTRSGRPMVRPRRTPSSVTRTRSPLNRLVDRLGSHRALGIAIVMAASTLCIAAWTITSTTGITSADRNVSRLRIYGIEPSAEGEPASEDAMVALLSGDPLKSYFGIPIEGDTVGYVVDCDGTMAPYIDQVAFITDGVNAMIEPGTRRFGIVQAVNDTDGHQLTEVRTPSDLPGASTILQSRLAAGETNLPGAFAITESWYANQIFLVLSKPLEEQEIGLLTQHAEQSGAVTHVIALGEAASQQSLSAISDATGGSLMSVSDSMLNQLVARYDARLSESNMGL